MTQDFKHDFRLLQLNGSLSNAAEQKKGSDEHLMKNNCIFS